MDESNIRNSWQYGELVTFLRANSGDPSLDSKTVFLVNPAQREEIDKIIYKHLWPAVIKGVGSSGIWIKALEGTFPKSRPEDEMHPYTTRSLTFLLEDPRRPLSPVELVPWYCRGKILATVNDYMLSFDFYVYFPQDFSLSKLASILKNQEFAGMPPELSYSKSHGGFGTFTLAFSKGHGAGWGLHAYQDAANRIREDINLNIAVVQAVYELENDPKNTKSFKNLVKALVRAYGSN